tara:strand:+ start:161 stop:514 length:354 start_codon:yes stop_codon:yes gene_type:complete
MRVGLEFYPISNPEMIVSISEARFSAKHENANMPANSTFEISLDQEFQPFIPAAILRLSYIYPEQEFLTSEQGVTVNGTSETDPVRLEREVTYQVYREKIFQQTIPMRQGLYEILAK